MIKDKKRKFIEQKLNENVGKPKDLWKTIKSLGLPSKVSPSMNICLKNEKGNLIFDPKENANIFKNFFSNLANELLSKLPSSSSTFSNILTSTFYSKLKIPTKKFDFYLIDEESIYKDLIEINSYKAAGIDNLSGIFLRDGARVLALPISQICNLSIEKSVFPRSCKIAKLKPLFKKGSLTEPKNYRPISLLPLISKLIERVIHRLVLVHLDKNEILFKFQSGFRSNHSTDSCLSYLNDKILKGFDKGFVTGMIACFIS